MAKTKVAILGGGIGALAAAFDIVEQDPTGALFEVTLYQMGWRLGGKCGVGWTDGPDRVRRPGRPIVERRHGAARGDAEG